ncbi:hypothetical protein ACPF3S_003195 [Vibrio cholerae]|nr:hypothetical protein [Vibrio cholerae]EKF9501101.1 hypothetical protein [Vibrio cholerae]HEJ2447559.1 hypothetical protein [Vibrio cholerae]
MNSEKYVHNIYGCRGDLILATLADGRFQMIVKVSVVEPEEHCHGYHSYEVDVHCPTTSTVTQAIVELKLLKEFKSLLKGFDKDDCDVVVTPKSFILADLLTQEKVLGGVYTHDEFVIQSLSTNESVRSDINARIAEMQRSARFEMLSDNSHTAKQLRHEAELLSFSLFSSLVSRSEKFVKEISQFVL